MHRLGGALDPLPRDGRERACDLHRLLGGGGGALGREVAVRGEAPYAVDQHPDGQPDHCLVGDAGDRAVAQRDRLRDDPLDTHVGVLGAAHAGTIERGVGEGAERQRTELRVDAVEHLPNLERAPGGTGKPWRQLQPVSDEVVDHLHPDHAIGADAQDLVDDRRRRSGRCRG